MSAGILIRHALLGLSILALATAVQAGPDAPAGPDAAVRSEAPARPEAPARRPWSEHVAAVLQASFEADPAAAVRQGRHEFDGMLPDWSPAALARQQVALEQARTATLAYPEAMLTERQQFERDYVLANLDGALFWLRDMQLPFHNPSYYMGSLDPSVYLSRPYAPLAVRLQAFIRYLHAVPAAAAQIRANLRQPLPATFVTLGINGFGGYPSFFRDEAIQVFAAVKDEALQAQLREAVPPAATAMQALADWLKSRQAEATEDFALGPDNFARMLQATERVDVPLDQLAATANADLQRNRQALADACARFAPGASLQACVDRVNDRKAPGGAVEGARAQLDGLRSFIAAHDLVTIPGTEQAQVAEAPSYQRWNFAYIDIAGPYDLGMPSVYNIAPPDPAWPAAEQAAYTPGASALLFTSAHEVWPGHFLQFLHANRSDFQYGRVFVGYAFAEGWAHYSEEMMWQAGLGDGADEVHIGQLLEALLRNVRFECALGLHTRHMRVAECETLFREQGFVDAGNARQQAARGTFDPAYLNYTLGKLMILKLREDWTATRGGRAGWKAFHDAFLSYGGPPIPLVRRQMLGSAAGGAEAVLPAVPAVPAVPVLPAVPAASALPSAAAARP